MPAAHRFLIAVDRYEELLVQFDQLEQMLVALLGGFFVLFEQNSSTLGELAGQTVVTGFVGQEFLVTAGGSLGIQDELLAGFSSGVEAEGVPVAALDSLLHLILAVHHAALDGVHFAGAVSDDQGRTVVSFGFLDGLDGLSGVGAHSDLSNVDIAIGHGDFSEALLLHFLTGSCELCNLTDVGSLGSLTAGVGVNFGIEYEDVDVFAGSENMVNAAEADVVCPAVAAEDPNGLLGEVILLGEDFLDGVAANVSFEVGNQSLGSGLVCFAVVMVSR